MRPRFSRHAQTILATAQAQAEARGHTAPSAWDVLAAILGEKGGSAAVLLRRAGMDQDALQTKSRKYAVASLGADAVAREHAAVLDAALGEAQRLGHEMAGTSHLLMGILKHGKNEAASFLADEGLDLLALRQIVLSCVGDRSRAEPRAARVCQRPNLLAVTGEWRHTLPEKFIDRSDIVRKTAAVLGRALHPNAVLVGVEGSGRRSILSAALPLCFARGLPTAEVGLQPIRVDLARLVGWRMQRAQQKINDFLREIENPGPFLMVIEDIDLFARGVNWNEALFLLRLILQRSAFPVAFVCAPDTHEHGLARDSFLAARVTAIHVPIPRGEEALRILRGVRDRLEAFHSMKITDEAVDQAFMSGAEVNEDDAFPLAIMLLDQAASTVRTGGGHGGDSAALLHERLAAIAREKQEAVALQDYARAARLRDEENALKQEHLGLALAERAPAPLVVDAAAVLDITEPVVAQANRRRWEGA